jgi:hypothetical protein
MVLVLAMAGIAAADTKVVRVQHTDGFSIMGQETPAEDAESVIWLGEDRMSRDDGSTAMIVRLDEKKMYVIDHESKTASVLDLPIDFDKIAPPGMAEAMRKMASFDITVTPSDETKTVGEWKARRYEIKMKGPMVQATTTLWVTTDTDLDASLYKRMTGEMLALQPGMDALVEELKKIEGYDVLSETTTSMMGATVGSSDRVTSVEKADPPAGVYEVPEGYSVEPFDISKLGQR